MEREPLPRARSRWNAPGDRQGTLEEAAGWLCHPRAAQAGSCSQQFSPWSRYSDIAEMARPAPWSRDRLFGAGTCSLLPGPAQVSPVCFVLFASDKKRTKQPRLVMVLLLLGVRMSQVHLTLIPGDAEISPSPPGKEPPALKGGRTGKGGWKCG